MVKSKKWIIAIIVPLMVILLIAFFIVSRVFTNNTVEEVQGVPVRVTTPFIGKITRFISYSGNLYPSQTITVLPRIAGKVDNILIEKGDRIGKDDALIFLEDETIGPQLDQTYAALQAALIQYQKVLKGAREEELENARALVEQAKKDLKLAEDNFDRIKILYDEGAISQSEYEEAENKLESARTAVENAERNLEMMEEGATEEDIDTAKANVDAMEAQYRLMLLKAGFKVVKAPAGGLVADILVDVGNFVSQTVPLLVIVQDNPIEAKIFIPEKYYEELLNKKDSITVEIMPTVFLKEDPFTGIITNISPIIDPASRTFEMEVQIDNPEGLLRPGMYINSRINIESYEDALLVPQTALLKREDSYIIFCIKEDNADGDLSVSLAYEKKVEIGLKDRNNVQILGGLKKEDRIIYEGNSFLEDGEEVRIIE
jgi:HlyD family secretion protein